MRECQEREWNTNSICVGKEKKKTEQGLKKEHLMI